MPAETFGQRLREARERKGLSAYHLAARARHAGLDGRWIEAVESGEYEERNVGIVELGWLCDALGCSADSLLGRKGSEVDRAR